MPGLFARHRGTAAPVRASRKIIVLKQMVDRCVCRLGLSRLVPLRSLIWAILRSKAAGLRLEGEPCRQGLGRPMVLARATNSVSRRPRDDRCVDRPKEVFSPALDAGHDTVVFASFNMDMAPMHRDLRALDEANASKGSFPAPVPI